jgi:hypothetical protein
VSVHATIAFVLRKSYSAPTMSEGSYGPPPGENPPQPPRETPPEPAPEQAPQPAREEPPQPSWLPPQPETPAAAEYPPAGEAGTPSYYPPPEAAMGPPPRRRSLAPIIAAVVIVVVLIAAIGGYLVAGVAFAQSRLSNANNAYNTVVAHQNNLNDTINGLSKQMTTDFSNASTNELTSDKSTMAQIVTKSQAAQSEIDSDDAALAKADDGLKENQWLTVLRKSDIDKQSTRIGHARKALATAKVITSDYVQVGNFFQAFYDLLIDFDTLGAKAQAQDLTGVAAADEKLKTDTTKAISLDKAPGIPAEMDQFLQDVKALANDFSALLNARTQSAQQAAEKALNADLKKIESVDSTKMGNDIDGFYQKLIDQYNSEVDKANGT